MTNSMEGHNLEEVVEEADETDEKDVENHNSNSTTQLDSRSQQQQQRLFIGAETDFDRTRHQSTSSLQNSSQSHSKPSSSSSSKHQSMSYHQTDFNQLRKQTTLQAPASLGLGLGLGLFPRKPIDTLVNPDPYQATPITAPILSLATHPDISRPLPAVLSAGHCTPGPHYSRSPSVASLENIISHASPSKPSTSTQSTPKPENENVSAPNLTAWWSSVASLFAVEGFNDKESSNESNEINSTNLTSIKSSSSTSIRSQSQSSESDSSDTTNPSNRRQASTSSSISTARRLSNWWTNSTQSTDESIETEDLTTQMEGLVNQGIEENHQSGRFRKPKFPLVLCHGLFGFDLIGPEALPPLRISYWRGVKEALEKEGVEVLVARVPASASIEERARILAQFIEEKLPGREVNLIGHSMGGLDSRFLITHLKPTSFKVASLTTIATPHRGSAFADYVVLDILGTNHLPKLMNLTQKIGIPGGGKAFEELTMKKMEKFNTETPDDPNVLYFSYGACFEPGLTNLFRIPWGVIYEREGPNDGMVSISSATWGEYKGTLENVNHLDLVGWTGMIRYAYAEWTGKKIEFQPVSFFLEVAESLADKGL
ncbi:Alpha/Beta hydrolase protein [Melampsora americana]|nr:Alpha/Beta hydrolase protein [Melampsora americana]